MTGGMHGGGCVAGGGMHGRGPCMAGETATAADGTQPTEMRSCFQSLSIDSAIP